MIVAMKKHGISRRKFIGTASVAAISPALFGMQDLFTDKTTGKLSKEIVSIVRIKNGNIPKAVDEAIDLLGGIKALTEGRNKILLKPNLVAPDRNCTTKPEVVKALAHLMLKAGKSVKIGEGSAAAPSFNIFGEETCRTKKKEVLDAMQQSVFDTLGYTEMASSLKVPLVNLHSGHMVEVMLNNGLAAQSVKIHKEVFEADLVCSVPMMKTHVLATVTLAMKNLIGLYPGTEYYSVRSWLHEKAAERGSTGVSYEIVDMNHAVRTGLSVIDASTAMEGDGPSSGDLVDMGLIVAGTSPLATDMVGTALMGFDISEIPYIKLAHETGMSPASLSDIEIRGQNIDDCKRQFKKPNIVRWNDISKLWGVREV